MSLPRLSTIVIVLTGGLVLAGIVIPTVPDCGPSKEQAGTKFRLSEIQIACFMYRAEYGAFPVANDAAHLLRQLESENPRKLHFFTSRDSDKSGFRDAWDRPIMLRTRAGYMELRSAAKDGIFFTKDDLLLDFSPDGLR